MSNLNSWGDIKVGDHVTTRGRHGVGQPLITGIVIELRNNTVTIQPDDGSDNRRRSARNVRKTDDS